MTCNVFVLTVAYGVSWCATAMKNDGPRRIVEARLHKGVRLVGTCDTALKDKVARARDFGLDESKLVRLSVESAIDALLDGTLVVMNGKLVPAALAPPPL